MREFEIGNRVVARRSYLEGNEDIHAGDSGTVCQILNAFHGVNIGVCWDHYLTNGHSCDGSCEYGFGWRVSSIDLDFLEEEEDFDIEERAFVEILRSM